jgi:PAS domain S-box-containing protein
MKKRQSSSHKTASRRTSTPAENATSNNEERYRLVIEAVAEGIYDWTIETKHLELSTRLTEMLGFKQGELTSENWVERVHPEDRSQYRDATIAYFKGNAPYFSCQYRILNKAGEWRWVSDRASSIRDTKGRVSRLIGAVTDITEMRETLQQQATTAEVLKAISRSTFDLQTVLDTLVESATRLCEADHAWLFQRAGDAFRWAAGFGHSTDVQARLKTYFADREVFADRGSITGRAALEGKTVHITDVLTDPEYTWGQAQEIASYRSALGVPLLRDGIVIGVIFVGKIVPQPFTEKQMKQVSVFADQAVIAIENTRLLNELRKRTDDLSESLQQQIATADVLKVISRSTFDLQTVLDTLIETAVKLCEARRGAIMRREGDTYHGVAFYNTSPELIDFIRRHPISPGRHSITARVALEQRMIHVADLQADPEYAYALRDMDPIRTELGVPMFRGNEIVGVVILYKLEVQPFTDKQIELVSTFADQAVIAIENTRLLNELRGSLQQQTATADVLKVISRSTFDLQMVLDTLVESAAELCEADMATMSQAKDETHRQVAAHGYSTEYKQYMDQHPVPFGRGSLVGRVLMEAKPVQIIDVQADPEYTFAAPSIVGVRTMLGAPLLREGTPVGVLILQRKTVRPFTERQVELVSTFADQAAIAIENVRLFDEIQDKSRQLAEASQHKSQFLANMSHELRTPLNAIIGVSEMLREDAEALKQDTEPLDRVLGAGQHLLALINDILDLSKIEAGRMELHLDSFALAPLIADVVKTIEPLAAKNSNQVSLNSNAAMGTMHADQMRLRQALLNLMSNANKFTDRGTITINAYQKQQNGRDWITLAVTDTGIGMTAEQMGKLFQEFTQASSTTTSKYGGTGLGLVISRRFCQMMGGDITVESEPGCGSTFTIRLPRIVETPKEAVGAQPAHTR